VDPEQRKLLEKVAEALTRGQGNFTKAELMGSFQEAWDAKVAGAMVGMLEDDLVDLALKEGKLVYISRSAPDAPPANWSSE